MARKNSRRARRPRRRAPGRRPRGRGGAPGRRVGRPPHHRVGLDQGVPLPGLRPGDPAGDPARRGLARRRRAASRTGGTGTPPAGPRATAGGPGDEPRARARGRPRRSRSGPARSCPPGASRSRCVTSDGLRLVGELAVPGRAARPRPPWSACTRCPTHGGMMDSHVLRKASWRLPALAGVAVLRFNTRGHDQRRRAPARARSTPPRARGATSRRPSSEALRRELPRTSGCWAGRSAPTSRSGTAWTPASSGRSCSRRRCATSTDADLDRWAADGRPLTALVPEHDDYLRPAEAQRAVRPRSPRPRSSGSTGAKHLWVGEPYVRRVLDEVVARLVGPAATPLPTTWEGPYTTHSDL